MQRKQGPGSHRCSAPLPLRVLNTEIETAERGEGGGLERERKGLRNEDQDDDAKTLTYARNAFTTRYTVHLRIAVRKMDGSCCRYANKTGRRVYIGGGESHECTETQGMTKGGVAGELNSKSPRSQRLSLQRLQYSCGRAQKSKLETGCQNEFRQVQMRSRQWAQ